ncbi:hypothetical protein ASZ90_005421 [hydrocarbon metagenome]|uniref:Uncharacterized protein n=1 Tax=hydrocarbon metagenome TaxID=938273 RepID=A0A0W8FV34_9ZZZZ
MTKIITKKYLLLILSSIGIMLLISSCVDTDVVNIPTNFTDLKSKVRFVNQVAGADAVVSVEGTQVGTIPPDGSSSYVEFLAGRKRVTVSYSTGPNLEENLTFDTDYKITFSIVEDPVTGERSFQKKLDGYVWD